MASAFSASAVDHIMLGHIADISSPLVFAQCGYLERLRTPSIYRGHGLGLVSWPVNPFPPKGAIGG